MPYALVFPMFAMVGLTSVIMMIGLVVRVHAVRSGQMDSRYFKTFTAGMPTEMVVKTSRHLTNLFEVPVIFYVGSLAGMMVGVNGPWPLLWAWLFVASRVAHAGIHIGRNKIYPRMAAFIVGCIAIWGLWLCVVLKVLATGPLT